MLRNLVKSEQLAALAERFLRAHYSDRIGTDWYSGGRVPEWFDHRADLFLWAETRVPFWVERGVFSHEVMFEGCSVLDLCCGDGFYPFYFYSGLARQIDAVDYDEKAIEHAKRWHSDPRITYARLDVVADSLPGSDYDVVTWDGAIEHFSLEETRTVLRKVKDSMDPAGVLSGYTVIAGKQHKHPDHQHEFESGEEMRSVLSEFFTEARTLETVYPERHNLYFRASDRADRLGGWQG